MKEEDLNEALHDLLVRSSPPAPMDPARALDQARRAHKRRTVAWAGAAAATLAVGAVVGPALVANYPGPAGQTVVGGTSATLPSPATPSIAGGTGTTKPTVAPSTRKTGDPWPDGQVDRTATVGPRADRAVTLMNDLSSAVPPEFSTPNLKYPDGRAMRWPQSQYASSDGEQDYWEYMAVIPVQKANGVGQLLVQSTTPDGKGVTDLCQLAKQFWGGSGSCAIVNVDGKKVGVVTTNGAGSYDQWAAYRYDDGTVVRLAQTKQSDDPARSPLTQPVFTTRELAELATSATFKISN